MITMKNHTVTLPNGDKLVVGSTGVLAKVEDVPDAGLFWFQEQVWERCGQSSCNLSDLEDGSEPPDGKIVMRLRQVRIERFIRQK